MKALLAAFRFLTILPTPGAATATDRDLGRSTGWFPLVGAALGAAAGAVLMSPLPPLLAGALATASLAVLTRALHLDGLGDTVDAFGSGRTNPAEIRQIMKDPRAGNFAAAAIALVLIVKTASATVLAEQRAWAALPAAVIGARWAAAAGIGLLRYARPEGGLGSPFFAHAGIGSLLLAGATAALLLLVLLPAGWGLIGAAAGLACLVAVAAASYRKIGGVTGDVLGAVVELSETTALAGAAIAAARGLPLSDVWWGRPLFTWMGAVP
jgi:adenosylcobinamide-GDP ribazoletransferase